MAARSAGSQPSGKGGRAKQGERLYSHAVFGHFSPYVYSNSFLYQVKFDLPPLSYSPFPVPRGGGAGELERDEGRRRGRREKRRGTKRGPRRPPVRAACEWPATWRGRGRPGLPAQDVRGAQGRQAAPLAGSLFTHS